MPRQAARRSIGVSTRGDFSRVSGAVLDTLVVKAMPMKRAYVFLFLTGLMLPGCGASLKGPALQGSGVSSGGDVVKDANNPWFVGDVHKVAYCLDLDPVSVSARRAVVESTVKKAFEFWHEEFVRLHDSFYVLDGLGLQEFVAMSQG